MERPRGEDVARLNDTRNVVRTANGLEEVGARPPAAPPKMNRTDRRKILKFMRSEKGKAVLARAEAEAAQKRRDDEDAARAIAESKE